MCRRMSRNDLVNLRLPFHMKFKPKFWFLVFIFRFRCLWSRSTCDAGHLVPLRSESDHRQVHSQEEAPLSLFDYFLCYYWRYFYRCRHDRLHDLLRTQHGQEGPRGKTELIIYTCSAFFDRGKNPKKFLIKNAPYKTDQNSQKRALYHFIFS